MNKHWVKASKRQIEWADTNGLWVAPEEDRVENCRSCVFMHDRAKCRIHGQPCFGDDDHPHVIFKRKEEPANE